MKGIRIYIVPGVFVLMFALMGAANAGMRVSLHYAGNPSINSSTMILPNGDQRVSRRQI
jgi:hypothetical protein